MRPVTMLDGLARRDKVSAASLARALKSSMVSDGLFSVGKIDRDFSNIFPISLKRPGLSSRGGGAVDGAGSAGCGAGRSGTACRIGGWTPGEDGNEDGGGEDGGAVCGHATPAANITIDNTAAATQRLPDRSSMTSSLALKPPYPLPSEQ